MTYEQAIESILKHDERVMVVTAENRAAIRNLPSRIGDRFVDVGIAEQTMIGMCAGLALRGRIPVAHALASFLTLRAFEFIRTDLGISGLPVKLVGGVPGFLSEANGPTHQAIEDVSLMRGIPNMGVFCPADEEELLLGLPAIIEAPQPFYIRYSNLRPVVSHDHVFEIGSSETFGEGSDAAILVYGILLKQALEAQEILMQQGINVRVVYFRTVKPIDQEAILGAARECSLLITLEDHFLHGGLYSIVAETLLEHRLSPETLPIALRERWFKPAMLNDVLEYEGFTGKAIAGRLITQLEKSLPDIRFEFSLSKSEI